MLLVLYQTNPRTVNAPEKTPLSEQRKLIEDVIQFAEFHPIQLRLASSL